MAKYRVLVKSFIDGHIRNEGDIVEYAGKPGSNLEPVDAPAKAAAAEAAGSDAFDKTRMAAAILGAESADLPAGKDMESAGELA